MRTARNRVCPVELADSLDTRNRRWLQDPHKILGSYIEEGMTVLDLGCGPGFFAAAIAQMVGPSGRVIAADLQEGMLQKLEDKIAGTELGPRITLHKCEQDEIGVSQEVDFVLAFYVMHEVPDQANLLRQIGSIVKPNGRLLIVEPPLHVSRRAFAETVRQAQQAGFVPIARPRLLFNRTVLLRKA
jgi:ubiquinone/menaquinone biosynthesis C-methylase UbiE